MGTLITCFFCNKNVYVWISNFLFGSDLWNNFAFNIILFEHYEATRAFNKLFVCLH